MNTQIDSILIPEPKYDTLEVIQIDDNLMLLQVSEDGESESILIGPKQRQALLHLLAVN